MTANLDGSVKAGIPKWDRDYGLRMDVGLRLL